MTSGGYVLSGPCKAPLMLKLSTIIERLWHDTFEKSISSRRSSQRTLPHTTQPQCHRAGAKAARATHPYRAAGEMRNSRFSRHRHAPRKILWHDAGILDEYAAGLGLGKSARDRRCFGYCATGGGLGGLRGMFTNYPPKPFTISSNSFVTVGF